MEALKERLKSVPARPGTYIFRDRVGTVLYVGKASSLRSRMRSYFVREDSLIPKLRRMMLRVADFEYMVTGSEQEALLLENNLIKKYRPHFNVRLRDDKSYPFIKITVQDDWPQVTFTRQVEADGSRYFGPFASANSVRMTLDLVKRVFRYCSRPTDSPRPRTRPCFDFHIQRCLGACIGLVSQEDYRQLIGEVMLFLEGRQEQVLQQLKAQMEGAAERLDFEKAALLRDQVRAVEGVIEEQVVAAAGGNDCDVIALARDKDEACVQVFFIRGGKVVGRDQHLLLGAQDEGDDEVLATFLGLFYGSASYVPPLVLLPILPREMGLIKSWLAQRRGAKVELRAPQRGEKRKLVEMVAENAAEGLIQSRARWLADAEKTNVALEELKEKLALPAAPRRIECYDISDIQGTSAVGSMVVFQNGKPLKSDYRRFKVRSVAGNDDYAMMREVLLRRFRRLAPPDGAEATSPPGPLSARGEGGTSRPSPRRGGTEGEVSAWSKTPDLVLIDGGKGHLHAAQEALSQVEAALPLASIAKEHEDIFLPGREDPVRLPSTSPAMYLVQRVRDEAHRFALAYHHRLRQKRAFVSALDTIQGIGPKRKKALLRQFGSVQGIREAAVEDVAAVEGMTRSLAERVKGGL